ncbi:MAG TPA: metal-dependent hydrolase [Opitutaceae bacterium]|jgi:hypothetical protein|nr:metal-dependent hydrolase [Opitutaceae bacterium]
MPNFHQHAIINALAVAAIEVVKQRHDQARNPAQKFDWSRFIVSVGAGTLAGALPDILEPSLGNPNHRGFCHSLTAAILAWWLTSGRHTQNLPVEIRRCLAAMSAGYTLHLGADLFFTKAKGMGFIHARF